MTNFNFEGEVKEISSRQLEFIGSVLEEHGFKDGTVQVQAVGKAGDNYSSNIKRIIIENNGKTFKMIAKIAPTNEMLRAFANMGILFVNEIAMYTEILPKFTAIQKEAGVPEEERLRYATCYGTFTEAPNEVIVLEDLQVSDYVMLDRLVSFDDNTVKLVLRNFAAYHSLSYALRAREPEIYAEYASKLTSSLAAMAALPPMALYFKKIEDTALMLLDSDKHKDAVNGTMARFVELIPPSEERAKESKYSVILQGDAWTNNLMFKLKNNKTVDCCMVDYQLSRQSTPVYDLHYMIFNCTDYETRSLHFHEWIDYYHSELDKSLSIYGLKASYIYPREQLNIEMKRQGRISFAIALMMAGVQNIESKDAEKMKSAMDSKDANIVELLDNVASFNDNTMMRYKSRVQGLIDSFIELEYL